MTDARKVEFYRHDLGDAELASVKETLDSLFLTTGPRTATFERALADYLGVPHAVGVSSCTDGLFLSLVALGIGPGDEVITTPMTFIATSNVVLHAGAIPRFVDVEPDTGLIDPEAVRAAIGPKTKAIIAVHLYGQMANMKALRQIADEHGLALIEDSAHGIEMRRDGVTPGQLGDVAVFSFYATKTITCGDGGAVACRDDELDTRLRRLRSHGMSKDASQRYGGSYRHWDMVQLGYKAGMTDIEAALLLPQLQRADARRDARERCVQRYERGLASLDGCQLLRRSGTSSHHLMTVLVPAQHRDDILAGLGEAGIGVAVNYRPVHLLSYYRDRFGFEPGMFPHAEQIGARTVSLPLYPQLSDSDIDYVVKNVHRLVGALER